MPDLPHVLGPSDRGAASDAAPSDPDRLVRVLLEIQRRGAIGRGPVDAAVEHAAQFVHCLPSIPGLLVDLGSGGGLPGLVIAAQAPAWRVVLIERRAKRADLLRYGVRALGAEDRVEVLAMDTGVAARMAALRGAASVVTARSFAAPLVALSAALPFLASGGVVVISEPPDGQPRWTGGDLAAVGLVDLGRASGVRRFGRVPSQA